MKAMSLLGVMIVLLASFGVSSQPAPVTFSEVVKSTKSWDGSELPQYPEGKPEITILKVTVPVGATVVEHKHPVINAGVMLSGELTVTSREGKELKLKAGEPIVELVDQWHTGKNVGTEPVEIMVFYAGIEGQPLSIKHTD
jgi:quercetin dioxygenase-like cupin family protein